VKLTTHLQVALTLRMSGAITPLPRLHDVVRTQVRCVLIDVCICTFVIKNVVPCGLDIGLKNVHKKYRVTNN
jgi:hypothetical protein